jgi:hypothetical protein
VADTIEDKKRKKIEQLMDLKKQKLAEIKHIDSQLRKLIK